MHLRVYRPAVVIIDLGLPDGYGEALITDLSHALPRVDVILGTSGDPDGEMRAVVAGADGFLPKPMGSLAAFQSLILKHLPADRQPQGLRVVTNDHVVPDLVAYEDDLAQAAEVLSHCHDGRSLDYVTQFLSGIARSADDHPLTRAVAALDQCRHDGQPILPSLSRVMALVQDRLSAPSGQRLQ
jgi:response regulator of citrate/malate metabolism